MSSNKFLTVELSCPVHLSRKHFTAQKKSFPEDMLIISARVAGQNKCISECIRDAPSFEMVQTFFPPPRQLWTPYPTTTKLFLTSSCRWSTLWHVLSFATISDGNHSHPSSFAEIGESLASNLLNSYVKIAVYFFIKWIYQSFESEFTFRVCCFGNPDCCSYSKYGIKLKLHIVQ